MSNYLTDIDPIGEQLSDELCSNCDAPDTSYKGYCSKGCYNESNQ